MSPPIDWTKPICTDTTPPRRAVVVEIDDKDPEYPYQVKSAWFDYTEGEFLQWVGVDGVCCLTKEHGVTERATIRNVRPGDFPDAPDVAAMLAEALEMCRWELNELSPRQTAGQMEAQKAAEAALAAYEAAR